MKRSSASLTTREMIIHTTVRDHLIPVGRAIIKKPSDNTFWQGCWEKGTFAHSCWEYKLAQPLWKRSVEVPQKITTVTIVRLSIATSLYVVNPWTTQIWTAWVHLHTDLMYYTIHGWLSPRLWNHRYRGICKVIDGFLTIWRVRAPIPMLFKGQLFTIGSCHNLWHHGQKFKHCLCH